MFPLTSNKTLQNSSLVSSAQIKAILKDQMELNCLCIKQLSLKEFLSFQGWLPPNTNDLLRPESIDHLEIQKPERTRLEWSNSLAIARIKYMVEKKH